MIEFNYNHEGIAGYGANGVERLDVFNGDYITQIYVKDNHGNIIKQFDLNYDYFESDYNVGEFNHFNSNSLYRYSRLKLISVEEVGKPKFEFTYEENIKLPPINSFSIDFCGYFNSSNDVVNNSTLFDQSRHPKLYYYPNKFEKSLLPFKINSEQHIEIPGYFNREANDYAKAWSLTKVKYPTGGSVEFQYESNSFEVFGEEVKGGGIRVKKQTLKDENGNLIREMNYDYKKSINNITSGTLFSFPYFGHPIRKFFDSFIDHQNTLNGVYELISDTPVLDNINWKLTDKSNLLEDLTSGAFVGYSKVTEYEVGNGRKEFEYSSNNIPGFENKIQRIPGNWAGNQIYNMSSYMQCMDQFMITNSGFGSELFTDMSFKRGKLLKEKYFNENGIIIKDINYSYEENLFDVISFNQPTNKIKHEIESPGYRLIVSGKEYKIANFLLKDKETKLYDGVNEFITNEEYSYNDYGFIKSLKITDSKGDLRETKFYYPSDVTSINSLSGGDLNTQELFAFQTMSSNQYNDINQQIQIEEYLNNDMISNFRKSYRSFNVMYGRFLPSSFKKSFGGEPLETEYNFWLYDSNAGNPLVFEKTNGLGTVLIWGYNKSKIIAKFENFDDISSITQAVIDNLQSLSNNDDDNCKDSGCNEQLLRNELNNLRVSHPKALITTYTYDPLIGVTSITDPKGKVVYYEYDDMGRLKCTRDHDNNIEKVYHYNFKNN